MRINKLSTYPSIYIYLRILRRTKSSFLIADTLTMCSIKSLKIKTSSQQGLKYLRRLALEILRSLSMKVLDIATFTAA